VKADELKKAAGKLDISFKEVQELQTNPKVQDEILNSFKAEAKKAGLTVLETVVAVYPLLEPWSPDNGCLTATQKLVPKPKWRFRRPPEQCYRAPAASGDAGVEGAQPLPHSATLVVALLVRAAL